MKFRGCCGDNNILDFGKMDLPFDLYCTDTNLWISIATIIANPVLWNIVARWEYRTHVLSRTAGSAKLACTLLGISIILLGIFRDWRFALMLKSQPRSVVFHENWILYLGYLHIIVGATLTLTSFWSLGFYGTFLGDYFGILQEEKVTAFPFNILDNPMYIGSTMNFLGYSLINASPAGLLLTLLVYIIYKIALLFEEPYTEYIYKEKEKLKSKSV